MVKIRSSINKHHSEQKQYFACTSYVMAIFINKRNVYLLTWGHHADVSN